MALYKPHAVAVRELDALPTDALHAQVQLIQRLMHEVMKPDEHYGTIPGTNKPTLLKPGAEKLGLTFRLAPRYTIERANLPGGHREYEVLCELVHIPTGQTVGQGVGLCSTMESKYRYRAAERACPQCGAEAIIRGKAEYGGGWLCWKKKGGCNAKFDEGDPSIEDQAAGKVENPDIADVYNTVLKMAKKRAHVDAMLTATAASDIFTQDLEDLAVSDRQTVAVAPSQAVPMSPVAPLAPMNGRAEPITDAQWDLLEKLLRSHVFANDERGSYLSKARRWTKDQASSYIDRVQAELKRRKEAEARAEAEVLYEDVDWSEGHPFADDAA